MDVSGTLSTQTASGTKRSRRSSRRGSSSTSSKGNRRSRTYFHRAARRGKLGAIAEGTRESRVEEEEEDDDDHEETNDFMVPRVCCKLSGAEHKQRLCRMKEQLLSNLARTGGDPTAPSVKEILDRLTSFYDPSSFDPKQYMTPVTMRDVKLEDMWLTMSKQELKDCLGSNHQGDGMYTLGRMAFDMFRPTKLVCSIQGSFNEIDIVDGTDEESVKHVPRNLEADVRDGQIPVRTYNIITAFTIEPYDPRTMAPDSPNKGVEQPIQAIMTTQGYAMPYPKQNNRYSIWFSGGSIQLIKDANNGKQDQWQHIFSQKNMPQRTLAEKVNVFAAGLLMGATANEEMDSQGKISYHMKRPIAAYIDMLYLDETLRIMRGSSGTIYIMKRAPQDEGSLASITSWGSDSDCSSLTFSGDGSSSGSPSSPCAERQALASLDALPSCPTRRGSSSIPMIPDAMPSRPTRRMSNGSASPGGCRSLSPTGAPIRPIRSLNTMEAHRPPTRSCSPKQESLVQQLGSRRRGRRPVKVDVCDSSCLTRPESVIVSNALPSRPTRRMSNDSHTPRSQSPTPAPRCPARSASAMEAPRRPNRSSSPRLSHHPSSRPGMQLAGAGATDSIKAFPGTTAAKKMHQFGSRRGRRPTKAGDFVLASPKQEQEKQTRQSAPTRPNRSISPAAMCGPPTRAQRITANSA